MLVNPGGATRPPHLPSSLRDKPAATPAEGEAPDVLEVTYPSLQDKCRAAGSRGTAGLLRLGAPMLGGLLAGFPGIAVGLAVGGLDQLRSHPRAGLKQLALVAGLGSLLAAGATLAGPVWGGLLLGATVLGSAATGWREAAHQEPKVTIDPLAFAQEYQNQVRAALPPDQQPPFLAIDPSLSQESLQKQCAQATLVALQLAARQLPPGMAVHLAGQTAVKLLTPADRERLDGALLKVVKADTPPERTVAEGVPLHEADLTGPSPALATSGRVILDRKFQSNSDDVTLDFVTGHELSHVRHKDAVFKLGATTLRDLLNQACQGTGQDLALALVQLILQTMVAQESVKMELRADQEGLDYAVQRGHTQAQIEQAAALLLKDEVSVPGLLDTHPPRQQRLKALHRDPV